MIKYPEEIKQDDMLRNLERLKARLKRQKKEEKIVNKETEDYVKALENLINYNGRISNDPT